MAGDREGSEMLFTSLGSVLFVSVQRGAAVTAFSSAKDEARIREAISENESIVV